MVKDAVGTIGHPLRRNGGLCAVLGCEDYGRYPRISGSGWVIGYCGLHIAQADRLFGQHTAVRKRRNGR